MGIIAINIKISANFFSRRAIGNHCARNHPGLNEKALICRSGTSTEANSAPEGLCRATQAVSRLTLVGGRDLS